MRLTETEEHVSDMGIKAGRLRISPVGTVLLAMYGSIGTASIAAIPTTTNQAILGIQCGAGLDPDYLWFYLTMMQPQLASLGRGGTQANINATMIRDLEIPVRSLPEQRRIAAQLTAQTATVSMARHGLEVRGRALRDLRSHVLADAFPVNERSGFFPTRLGDVASLIRGVTFEGSEASYAPVPEAKPILRAGNISNRLITDRDLVWVPSTRVSPDQLMRTGDIAICMSSGSPAVVGKSALLTSDFPGSVGAFCAVIRPSAALPEYVAAWLQSPSFDTWRGSQTSGASIQNLKLSSLAGAILPMPSLDSQARIIRKLLATLSAIDAVEASIRAEQEAIEALPTALLGRAFEDRAA